MCELRRAPSTVRRRQACSERKGGRPAMTVSREHPYLPDLRQQLGRGRIDRREFLRTATLLGVAAGAAYAMAGVPTPARAQADLPKGGKIRIGMHVQEIKDPQTISWVEPSNVLHSTVQYLTVTDQN